MIDNKDERVFVSLDVLYDGKENVVLGGADGPAKYAVGEMLCEYVHTAPIELKNIIRSYPGRNDAYTVDNLFDALVWLTKQFRNKIGTAATIMAMTEIYRATDELDQIPENELNNLLADLNKDNSFGVAKEEIIGADGTISNKTIGDYLDYGFLMLNLSWGLVKGFLTALANYVSGVKNSEFIDGKTQKKLVETFCKMFQPRDLNLQNIDFKIIFADGKFSSLYKIYSSLSLLLFEMSHVMENGVKFAVCQNCGCYFVPTNGSKGVYCSYPSPQNPKYACRKIGPEVTRAKKEKEDEATHLYRNIYMRNKMFCKRHPENDFYKKVVKELVDGAKEWRL